MNVPCKVITRMVYYMAYGVRNIVGKYKMGLRETSAEMENMTRRPKHERVGQRKLLLAICF